MRGFPEVLPLSIVLRFALLTPATLAFIVLDWRGLIPQRWIPPIASALLIAPSLIAALEALRAYHPAAFPNFQAVPLLLLVVLTCRVGMAQAVAINLASCALFLWIIQAPFIPSGWVLSLAFTEIAATICTLMFAWRLMIRDRQVFLFTHQAAADRALLAAQNRALAKLSQVDALTGLGNRRCFDETLANLWQRGRAAPLTVTLIMFDIDCFKQFNDALGHQAGDECLSAIARAVTRCLRDERDTLVRYGGEEFAIILPDTTLEDGCAVAERVRVAVQDRHLAHPGGSPQSVVTISLGVASVRAPAQTHPSLVEAADRLLYEAKRAGRNQVAGGRTLKLVPRIVAQS